MMLEQWIQQTETYDEYLAALLHWSRHPTAGLMLSYWLRNVVMQSPTNDRDVGAQDFVRRIYQDIELAKERHRGVTEVTNNGGSEWDRSGAGR